MTSSLPGQILSTAPPLPTLFVIPSGVGCSIGGYAGDAIPAARLIAAASGCLITHPNVMNGAALYWSDHRIHYVEGYSLDRFAAGEIALQTVRQQRVGLLLDAGLEPELRHRHLQVADGCRATLGLNIGPVVITEVPLEVRLQKCRSGASWGELGNPDALINAGEELQNAGATAIAVVTRFPDDFESEEIAEYRQGKGVDTLAGAEAVISHLLVRHLGIPCAHSPAMADMPIDFALDPRAAGEELGYTFLSCVLVGLSRAPNLVPINQTDAWKKNDPLGILNPEQLGAVVAPNGALGGAAVLACLERGVPLISVSNPGILKVTSKALALKEGYRSNQGSSLFHARDYIEAAGMILLLREGINYESLIRPLPQVT